jgi:hypothetical protein
MGKFKELDMGYRSEVGYVIVFTEKEVYDQFKVQYKLDPAYDECREDESGTDFGDVQLKFMDDHLVVKFRAEHVKWYDHYSDVKCHRALLDLADEYAEKYKCVSWCFVRIGEETGDIDTEYGGDGEATSMIYPVSSICFDGV